MAVEVEPTLKEKIRKA
jgi:hypothetical protein